MMQDKIKARLNLNVVLRNLEELPTLDETAAALIRNWETSIRFKIWGDASVRLWFHGGQCVLQPETMAASDVYLFFRSPAHLNAMFEGKANPIPFKGFSRLGFLKNEFPKLTQRLEYFLKPTDALLEDDAYVHVNTTLSLHTAAHAVCELMRLDPRAKLVGAHMPKSVLQLSILPDGPHAHIIYDGRGGATAHQGIAEKPSAAISFKSCRVANALFNGKLDGFSAIALGDVQLRGLAPIIDNTNLILDRIPLYLQ